MKFLLKYLNTITKADGKSRGLYPSKSRKTALSYTLSLLSASVMLGAFPQKAKATSFTYNNTSSGAISSTTTSCASPLVRTFNVTDSFTVQDVNLGFNADHTYRGDIQATLKHPDGTSVQVISSSGGDSQAGYDVLLDSGSGNSLNDGNADNTGSPLYDRTAAPSNSLSSFNGKPSNGIWTLEVCDTFSSDDGTFNSAQLILDDTAPPVNASLPTGERPFSLRYGVETTGNIEATGNAVLTCNTSSSACNSALSAGTAGNNNGGLAMQMLDIDADGSTFNSSSAQLTIPTGANVLFAGLYWGGTSDGATTPAPDASKRNQALLATPSSGYQTIIADTFTSMDNSGTTGWDVYNSFADVTNLVKGAGSGTYTMANVQTSTGTGFTYPNAGWALVVVYEDPTEPRRNLTVFDGYQFTGFGSSITNTLSGLRTPPTAGFDVFMGAVAGDGEIDSTGDFLAINGTQISDTLNPSTNFFNGTISKFGSHITTRTPNNPFNLVIDIDYLDLTAWNQANNAIPTNATSIDVTLGTQGDGIWPMAYFFGVEVFEPNLVTEFRKTTPQTSYANGDIIPYTITVKNTGNDNAADTVITDAIPTGATFVPGSLKINGVTKTDGTGDDEAEFDGTNVIFRVGTGANGTQGGQLNINDTVTMTFDVTVTAAPGEQVCNQASIDYEGQTSGNAASGNSDDPNTPTFGDCTEITTTAAANNPNVLLVKRITAINGDRTQNPNDNTALNTFVDDTVSTRKDDDNHSNWPNNYLLGALNAGKVKPGDEIEYTVYFLNSGAGNADNVKICDRLLPNQTFKNAAYGANADVQLQLGTSAVLDLTAANDASDRAEFIAAAGSVPANCFLKGANDDGTLVIDITGTTGSPNLSTMPGSTGSGTPNDSYGFFRFTTKVDP